MKSKLVLFSIPRAVGWLAHWMESLNDRETRIYRPRQVYNGSEVNSNQRFGDSQHTHAHTKSSPKQRNQIF